MKKSLSFALFLGLSLQNLGFSAITSTAVGALLADQIQETSIIARNWKILEDEPVKILVSMTGYSSTPDQTDSTPFITASGKYVRDGIIATNFLPFGAKVKIPELFGNKIFVVEDRMASRYFHRIDIWFASREAALKFGNRKTEIVIL